MVTPLGVRTSNVLTLTPRPSGVPLRNNKKAPDGANRGACNAACNDYRSPTTTPGHKRPRLVSPTEDQSCGEEDADDPDDDQHDTNSTARVFPPRSYQDLAIPVLVDPPPQQYPSTRNEPRSQDPPKDATTDDDDTGTLQPPPPQPLHPKPHVKHVMSIHCTECRQFAVLAPAGLCWSSKFDCVARSKTFLSLTMIASCNRSSRSQPVPLSSASSLSPLSSKEQPMADTAASATTSATTWVGGMLVRTACDEANCQRPVFCHDCSHATQHAHYPLAATAARPAAAPPVAAGTVHPERRRRPQQPTFPNHGIPVQHSSRCDSCRLDYCPAHAWLSTVCHHW